MQAMLGPRALGVRDLGSAHGPCAQSDVETMAVACQRTFGAAHALLHGTRRVASAHCTDLLTMLPGNALGLRRTDYYVLQASPVETIVHVSVG